MRKTIILAMLLLILIIITSCKPIEKENIFLSAHEIVLDAGQNYDLYLGIKNNFDLKKDFTLTYSCNECNNDVIVQMFPNIGLDAQKSAAFPIRIIANEQSQNKQYEIEFIVREDSNIYGTDKLKITVSDKVSPETLTKEISI